MLTEGTGHYFDGFKFLHTIFFQLKSGDTNFKWRMILITVNWLLLGVNFFNPLQVDIGFYHILMKKMNLNRKKVYDLIWERRDAVMQQL